MLALHLSTLFARGSCSASCHQTLASRPPFTSISVSEQEVDEEKEERKAEMARMLLAGGRSFTEADADIFEGLSPAEIQAYVAENTQARCTPALGRHTSALRLQTHAHSLPGGDETACTAS